MIWSEKSATFRNHALGAPFGSPIEPLQRCERKMPGFNLASRLRAFCFRESGHFTTHLTYNYF